MTHIELLIKGLFLVGIGLCFFFFEGIVILNLFRNWGKWWTKELFESAKDRNGDGKISFMERTFPRDGGHFFKRLLVSLIGAGMSYYQGVPALSYLIYSFIGWWIASATFDITWTFMRKIISMIVLVALVSSCGTTKTTSKINVETAAKLDSTSISEVIIKTKLDSTIVIKADSIEGCFDVADTAEQVLESAGVKIVIAKGSSSKRKIKAISKTKDVQVKVEQETRVKTSTSIKKSNNQRIKTLDKQSESTGIKWWIWLLIGLGFIAFLSFRYAMR
ncbi:MAG: hypothetical protein L6Q78_10945 [Bacteroidia bacterium]|nr:hypothetical protein [Bacteroidia bacterium]